MRTGTIVAKIVLVTMSAGPRSADRAAPDAAGVVAASDAEPATRFRGLAPAGAVLALAGRFAARPMLTVFCTAGSIGFRNTPGTTPMKIAIAQIGADHEPLAHAEVAQPAVLRRS